ncbi:YvrJ family protein [Caloranaerobacter azorensis]|uniref:YvrJ family protein n=1 Tax=Caloranaerobacter azorensis TaxID=116090 RepID=UPI0012E0A7C5|nr:YvrJ family protein [Caloranaerobacter azorensis]
MEDLKNFISQFGFQTFVAFFLLIRVEKKLDMLNNTLMHMIELIANKDIRS